MEKPEILLCGDLVQAEQVLSYLIQAVVHKPFSSVYFFLLPLYFELNVLMSENNQNPNSHLLYISVSSTKFWTL